MPGNLPMIHRRTRSAAACFSKQEENVAGNVLFAPRFGIEGNSWARGVRLTSSKTISSGAVPYAVATADNIGLVRQAQFYGSWIQPVIREKQAHPGRQMPPRTRHLARPEIPEFPSEAASGYRIRFQFRGV